jgi:hypothetical protein
MSCDACKRIPTLTGRPCHYCGRLNVEAELAAAQLAALRATRAPDGELCRCPLGGGWNHDHDGERIVYRETPTTT